MSITNHYFNHHIIFIIGGSQGEHSDACRAAQAEALSKGDVLQKHTHKHYVLCPDAKRAGAMGRAHCWAATAGRGGGY